MNIIISGIKGHMGAEVLKLCADGCRGMRAAAGVDVNAVSGETVAAGDFRVPAAASFEELAGMQLPWQDCCVVDFSSRAATAALTGFVMEKKLPLVLATTGQTEEEKAMIRKASETVPVFFSANFSLGIALLIELAGKAAAAMPDAEIEIIEKHHDRKTDAPSGTALAIAGAIKDVRPSAEFVLGRNGSAKRTPDEIGIHAVRMGNIVGEHEVLIGTQNQTITLKHEAHSRALFAEGALAAAEFLQGKPAGLYQMKDLVK